jgi:hypothetical protein
MDSKEATATLHILLVAHHHTLLLIVFHINWIEFSTGESVGIKQSKFYSPPISGNDGLTHCQSPKHPQHATQQVSIVNC